MASSASSPILGEELDADQVEAATQDIECPLLIVAPPGGGKTRVLCYRVLYMIKERKVNASKILVVTFTKAAAAEFATRLQQYLQQYGLQHAVGKVKVCTIHSICYKILRENKETVDRIVAAARGDLRRQMTTDHDVATTDDSQKSVHEDDEAQLRVKSPWTVISRQKQQRLLLEVLKEKPPSQAQRSRDPCLDDPKELLLWMQLQKCNNLIPENFVGYRGYAFTNYERKLLLRRYIDFGSMISLAKEVLLVNEVARQKYRDAYQYLLVDEFQDTNMAQLSFFEALLGEVSGRITCVGDEDQLLYVWRGASAKIFDKFKEKFKRNDASGEEQEVAEIVLRTNHRSSENIVVASQQVIDDSTGKRAKKNIDAKHKGLDSEDNMRIISTRDPEGEASLVADCIQMLLDPSPASDNRCDNDPKLVENIVFGSPQQRALAQPLKPSDIAVLCRANKPLSPFVAEFRLRNFVCSRTENPYEREIVKDILAHLILASTYSYVDDDHLLRIINKPSGRLGKSDCLKYLRLVQQANRLGCLWEALAYAQQNGFTIPSTDTGQGVQTTILSFTQAAPSSSNTNPRLGGKLQAALEEFAKRINKIRRKAAQSDLSQCIDYIITSTEYSQYLANCAEKKASRLGSPSRPKNGDEGLFSSPPAPSPLDEDDDGIDGDESSSKKVDQDFYVRWLKRRAHAFATFEYEPLLATGDMSQEERKLDVIQRFTETIMMENSAVDSKADAVSDGITLSTIHQSKGLEFEAVFLVRANEGVLPTRAKHIEKDDNDTLEKHFDEERKLAYVAMTRAKHLLFVSHVRKSNKYSESISRYFASYLQYGRYCGMANVFTQPSLALSPNMAKTGRKAAAVMWSQESDFATSKSKRKQPPVDEKQRSISAFLKVPKQEAVASHDLSSSVASSAYGGLFDTVDDEMEDEESSNPIREVSSNDNLFEAMVASSASGFQQSVTFGPQEMGSPGSFVAAKLAGQAKQKERKKRKFAEEADSILPMFSQSQAPIPIVAMAQTPVQSSVPPSIPASRSPNPAAVLPPSPAVSDGSTKSAASGTTVVKKKQKGPQPLIREDRLFQGEREALDNSRQVLKSWLVKSSGKSFASEEQDHSQSDNSQQGSATPVPTAAAAASPLIAAAATASVDSKQDQPPAPKKRKVSSDKDDSQTKTETQHDVVDTFPSNCPKELVKSICEHLETSAALPGLSFIPQRCPNCKVPVERSALEAFVNSDGSVETVACKMCQALVGPRITVTLKQDETKYRASAALWRKRKLDTELAKHGQGLTSALKLLRKESDLFWNCIYSLGSIQAARSAASTSSSESSTATAVASSATSAADSVVTSNVPTRQVETTTSAATASSSSDSTKKKSKSTKKEASAEAAASTSNGVKKKSSSTSSRGKSKASVPDASQKRLDSFFSKK